jgi:hypothetical protein
LPKGPRGRFEATLNTTVPARPRMEMRQERDRDEEEVQHHEKLDRAHSRRAQINDVCAVIYYKQNKVSYVCCRFFEHLPPVL